MDVSPVTGRLCPLLRVCGNRTAHGYCTLQTVVTAIPPQPLLRLWNLLYKTRGLSRAHVHPPPPTRASACICQPVPPGPRVRRNMSRREPAAGASPPPPLFASPPPPPAAPATAATLNALRFAAAAALRAHHRRSRGRSGRWGTQAERQGCAPLHLRHLRVRSLELRRDQARRRRCVRDAGGAGHRPDADGFGRASAGMRLCGRLSWRAVQREAGASAMGGEAGRGACTSGERRALAPGALCRPLRRARRRVPTRA